MAEKKLKKEKDLEDKKKKAEEREKEMKERERELKMKVASTSIARGDNYVCKVWVSLNLQLKRYEENSTKHSNHLGGYFSAEEHTLYARRMEEEHDLPGEGYEKWLQFHHSNDCKNSY